MVKFCVTGARRGNSDPAYLSYTFVVTGRG